MLRLPRIPRGPLPGYLLIADRNNDRAIIVSPAKKIVWERDGLRGPDDTFFTPGYRGVITNEEFNDTLTEVSLKTKTALWRYGHDGVPGSSPGYLNTPDDAYRLRNGDTTVADIRNCRIVELTRAKQVRRILGGSCVHDPPRGFASPNGDTPLPDGGILVTEIGGWIDRLGPDGRLDWSIRSPGRVSVRCAAAPERTHPRRRLHRSRQDRRGDALRARRRGRSGARAGPTGSTSRRSRCACRTA